MKEYRSKNTLEYDVNKLRVSILILWREIKISLKITDREMLILRQKHRYTEGWIGRTIRGEINRVMGLIKQQVVDRIINDPNITSIPGDIDSLLDIEFDNPEYKDAAQR